MGFFDRPGDADPDLETIKRQQIMLNEAQARRERAQRLKAFLDSSVYRDVKSIIEELKETASQEARAYKDSSHLYGIDFLTKLEKALVAQSSII